MFFMISGRENATFKVERREHWFWRVVENDEKS